MMPLGLSGGASTRVANELGGSCPQAAKQAADVAVWMTLVLQVLVAVGMYLARYGIGYIFTDSALVRQATALLDASSCLRIADVVHAYIHTY